MATTAPMTTGFPSTEVLKEFIPRMEQAMNVAEYRLAVSEMTGNVQDSHLGHPGAGSNVRRPHRPKLVRRFHDRERDQAPQNESHKTRPRITVAISGYHQQSPASVRRNVVRGTVNQAPGFLNPRRFPPLAFAGDSRSATDQSPTVRNRFAATSAGNL